MPEHFDVYSDSVMVTLTPWGGSVTFNLGEAHPAPGSPTAPTQLGTVRMSNEQLKVMIFVIRRQLVEHEMRQGVQYDVPVRVLSQLGVAPEDWNAFWGYGKGA